MPDDEPILLLNRADVRRLLTWPELLAVTRRALVAATPEDGAFGATATQLVVADASLHLKAGAMVDPPTMSVKANLRPNTGHVSGAILAYDLERMRLHAILASADLTAMRTAAIAAVAAQTLVTESLTTLALLGAGPVAQRVHEVLLHLGLVSDVRVWSRDITRAQALIESGPPGHAAKATDQIESALHNANLVVTCTPSREPLFQPHHLHPQAVILAMGADSAGKRELPRGVMDRAVVYTDIRDDALQVGESSYLGPEAANRVKGIGSVLNGPEPVHTRTSGWTVFDSVGTSAADVAAVALVVQQARKLGLGQTVELND